MNPGVQNPHCNAACSRNFCCTGCSLSPSAMPSTVVILRPSASAPSIRHEHTILPSQITVQAPQSPELQPSLLPVRLSSSRSTSSNVCRGSQRNSTGSPLMTVVTWVLAMAGLLALGGAFKGDRGRAPCEDAVERDIHSAADDGDVHLGAWDEAQISVGLMGLWLWYVKLDDELTLLQRGLPRPGDDCFDRRLAPAAGPGDDSRRARGDQRRYAVGSRRSIAQVAGERGAPLDLFRAD